MLVNIIITYSCYYLRYTNTVDMWLKFSSIIPLYFVFSISIIFISLESESIIIEKFKELIQKEDVNILSYYKNVIVIKYKEESYQILMKIFDELIRENKMKKHHLYKIIKKINQHIVEAC